MIYYIIYKVKSNTIKDSKLDLEFDQDILFVIVLIEKSQLGCLITYDVGKVIASMPLYEFFDYLDYVK